MECEHKNAFKLLKKLENYFQISSEEWSKQCEGGL